jgi:acetyl-CoA carboxylase alpha subunit
MAKALKKHIKSELTRLCAIDPEKRIADRIEKFSRMGRFTLREAPVPATVPAAEELP